MLGQLRLHNLELTVFHALDVLTEVTAFDHSSPLCIGCIECSMALHVAYRLGMPAFQDFISHGRAVASITANPERRRRGLANGRQRLIDLAQFWTSAYELCPNWSQVAIFGVGPDRLGGQLRKLRTDDTDICFFNTTDQPGLVINYDKNSNDLKHQYKRIDT